MGPRLVAGLLLSWSMAAAALDCGRTVHGLAFDGMNRSYNVYLPPSVCSTPEQHAPALLTLHCLGCNGVSEMEKWVPAADEFGFVLISPEGIAESWNARYCCGAALAQGVDDLGFVERVVHAVSGLVNISADVYATGFSNGGFMASFLVTSGKGWVRAIAPTAGHVYQFIKAAHPTPVFLHHSMDDESVKFRGCCRDNRCCCGIVSKDCVGVPDIFAAWLKVNGCQGQDPALHVAGDQGVECFTGRQCKANTTYCAHRHVPHSSWSRQFPFARSVAEAFARDACSVHGTWAAGQCQCDADYWGRYCIDPKAGALSAFAPARPRYRPNRTPPRLDGGDDREAEGSSDWGSMVTGICALLAIVLTGVVYFFNIGAGGGPRRTRLPPEDEAEMSPGPRATTPKRRDRPLP